MGSVVYCFVSQVHLSPSPRLLSLDCAVSSPCTRFSLLSISQPTELISQQATSSKKSRNGPHRPSDLATSSASQTILLLCSSIISCIIAPFIAASNEDPSVPSGKDGGIKSTWDSDVLWRGGIRQRRVVEQG